MRIVFLDQNKWVDLARVVAGTSREAAHKQVHECLSSAVGSGQLIAPLSITQIIETAKRNDPEQRRDLARVQATISRGYVYRSRRARLDLEIANALRIAFGDSVKAPAWDQVVVPGFWRAFEPMDTPDAIRQLDAISSVMSVQEQYVDFMLNQDDRRRREAVASFTQGTLQLLKNIEERRALVADEKPEFRYRAYAVKLFYDHEPDLIRGLKALARSVEDLKALGAPAMVTLLRNIPTLDVEAEIAARLEAEDRALQDNDIRDVQSFYSAIPYSSNLVAERHFVSLAKQARLDRRYNVALHTNLSELISVLE